MGTSKDEEVLLVWKFYLLVFIFYIFTGYAHLYQRCSSHYLLAAFSTKHAFFRKYLSNVQKNVLFFFNNYSMIFRAIILCCDQCFFLLIVILRRILWWRTIFKKILEQIINLFISHMHVRLIRKLLMLQLIISHIYYILFNN